MSKENKAFAEQLQKFYENGLFKEVYRTENAIICNVFNQYYLAFSLDLVAHYTENFPCFMMVNSSGLLETMRNDHFVNEYYGYLTQEQKAKVLTFLNDELFEQLSASKEEMMQLPPQKKIDLEFEQEVMKKGKGAIKGLRWHKYFLKFLFNA